MPLKNSNYLKASTLIESIIALTICAACLAIAILIFVQVTQNTQSIKYLRAEHAINKEIYNDWLKDTSPVPEKIALASFTIEKNEESLDDTVGFFILNYFVSNGKYKIGRKIIFETIAP